MTKFIFLYNGGTYPESPEEAQKVMAAWEAWMGGLGDQLVDGGAPLGDKAHLGGASDSGINGYSVVEAASLDAAKELCAAHPHVDAGGGIEIATFMEM